MGPNLNFLEAFLLVAEHGSFRQAAEKCSRSQSALSAQIKELESQLGVQLFERATRRVSLTPEGTELLKHASKAFSEPNIGFATARKSASRRSEQICFASLPSICAGILPTVLAKFEKENPDVVTMVAELHNEEIIDAVRNGEAESGVGATPPASECDFESIGQDEVCAIVPSTCRDHPEGVISMADLISFPLLVPRPAPRTLHALQREARFQKKPLNLRHRFCHAQPVMDMVAEGHGVGLVVSLFLTLNPRDDLRILRIVNPSVTRDISIVTRRGASLSSPAEQLIDLIKEALAQKL